MLPPMPRHSLARDGLRRVIKAPLAAILVVCCLILAGALSPARADSSAPRLATVDWTIAETLVSLGVEPVAVSQVAEYQAWVEQPALPDSVVDIGLRAQPNRELVASLDLDRFLLSPLFAALEPTLSRIVPVTTLSIYEPEGDLWQNLVTATREIADIAGVPARAERVVEAHRERIAQVRDRLPDTVPELLVVQFIDDRHVRVYGQGSLYEMVLERLELDNAWQGGTNLWGYATAGLEKLTTTGYLVVVDPMPMGVEDHLASNRLWQSLPSVKAGQVLHLPAVWSFGGLPSAARFAEELGESLATSGARPEAADS